MTSHDQPPERYTHGYGSHTIRLFGERTAHKNAAFVLPHLKPGMSVLDCGCGSGSITLGLARVVAPGEVVGIDVESAVIEEARTQAEEQGTENLRFQTGSVYELPFPDSSFDAVFSHAVLEHLKDPQRALNEMRRVLKPGGLIGARDSYFSGRMMEPKSVGVEEFWELYERSWAHNGGDPDIGGKLPALFRQAGLRRVLFSASYDTHPIEGAVNVAIQRCQDSPFSRQVIDLGWADRPKLDSIIQSFEEWGGHPDAVYAGARAEVVGWKEG